MATSITYITYHEWANNRKKYNIICPPVNNIYNLLIKELADKYNKI